MKKYLLFLFLINYHFLIVSCDKKVVTNNTQNLPENDKCACTEGEHISNLWQNCKILYYLPDIPSAIPENPQLKIKAAFNEWAKPTGIIFIQDSLNNYNNQKKITFEFREYTKAEFDRFLQINNLPDNTTRRPVALTDKYYAKITIFTNVNWENSDPSKGKSYNFQLAITHEIGHVLGLGHINNETALMIPLI